jgi:hypothetical protein
MISLVDIFATMAAVLGEELPPVDQAAEDSRSFLPAILGDPARPIREDMIVHSSDGVFAIRKGPWKWIEGKPVDRIKQSARKAHADQFRPQLYNTHDDPAEANDLSTAQPEVVKELSALLDRYRNGGYSRELPPIVEKPAPKVAKLTPLEGEVLVSESLDRLPAKSWKITRGDWQAHDGALWGAQQGKDKQGATLHAPLALNDGTIQYQINFSGADRHSLRVEWGDREGSFRIEISRTSLGLTKNPSQGEDKEAVEPVARKALSLEPSVWYPVRIAFRGDEVTVQVNDVVLKGSHAVFGKAKTGMNFLVFGEAIGFRELTVAK